VYLFFLGNSPPDVGLTIAVEHHDGIWLADLLPTQDAPVLILDVTKAEAEP